MFNTNATNFRKDLYNLLDLTIKLNEHINISTKSGNAVLLSQEEYDGLIATAELCSNPKLKDKLIEGRGTPIEECVPLEEVEW